MTKSLYIHIPFCKKFCPYCDFVKCIYNKTNVDKYLQLVIDWLTKHYANHKFETIYIGGGTPNSLNDQQLELLLPTIKCYASKNSEITIELNPEFVTESQVKILFKNNVNRVSLGVQTLDNDLLKTMNRKNHKEMVSKAIDMLISNGIDNISCDLIYGFKNQTNDSIKNDIDFLIAKDVKHLSLYSLEIKDNSVWGKTGYVTNEEEIEDHLSFAINYLAKQKFIRYEVSNWAKANKYQSKHNVSVWNTNDWAAIGLGAHGMEKKNLYHFEGNLLDWKLIKSKLSEFDLYIQVMIMGLRLKKGLDLNNPLHKKAYQYFKKVLDNEKLITIKKNNIICNNINLLDNVLIKLMEYEKK